MHTRPLGVTGNSGSPATFGGEACLGGAGASPVRFSPRSEVLDRQRSGPDGLEGCTVSPVEPTPEGFISQLFLVPKKDGGQRPVINLKTLNTFVRVFPHDSRLSKAQRLDGNSGSERCVFPDTNPFRPPTLPQVSVGRPNLSVPLPSVWPVMCTTGVQKSDEASGGLPEGEKCPVDNIPGRHSARTRRC